MEHRYPLFYNHVRGPGLEYDDRPNHVYSVASTGKLRPASFRKLLGAVYAGLAG